MVEDIQSRAIRGGGEASRRIGLGAGDHDRPVIDGATRGVVAQAHAERAETCDAIRILSDQRHLSFALRSLADLKHPCLHRLEVRSAKLRFDGNHACQVSHGRLLIGLEHVPDVDHVL